MTRSHRCAVRLGVYWLKAPANNNDLALMRRIDELISNDSWPDRHARAGH
jgi:hypothetical protein